jgi:hypothetical protein
LILNPKQTWSASTQEVSGALDPGVTAKWYQYPVLAGDLTISGDVTVVVYVKASVATTGVTVTTTLSKVDSNGTVTQISTQSSTENLGTTYAAVTHTHSNVSATVSSGYNLELKATLYLAGATTTTGYIGYDTSTENTGVTLPCEDHFTITLTANRTYVVSGNTVTFTVTATDDFGGIDLQTPTITVTDVNGNVRVNAQAMTAQSVSDSQYTNTWTYTVNPLNLVGYAYQGVWHAQGTIKDQAGSTLNTPQLSFTYALPGGKKATATQTPAAQPSVPTISLTPTIQVPLTPTNIALAFLIILIIAGLAYWWRSGG